jgi:hypothetical protein
VTLSPSEALLLVCLFFLFAGAVLKRFRIAVENAIDERECMEQLAQPGDVTSRVVAPSQSALQAKDGHGGFVAGAALAAHSSPSIPDGVQ